MKKIVNSLFLSPEDRQLMQKALFYLKPHKMHLFVCIVITLLGLIVGTLQPLIFGKIIDILTKGGIDEAYKYVFLMLFVMAFESVAGLIETYFITSIANKIVFAVRTELFSHILQLPMKTFDSMKKGEFVSRFETDISALADTLTARVSGFIIDICRVIVIGFVVFKINATLALFLTAVFPVSYLIFYLFGKKIRSETVLVRKLADKSLSFLQDSLLGIKEIKQFMVEKVIEQKMFQIQEVFFAKNIRKNMFRAFANFANNLFAAFAVAVLFIVGLVKIGAGILTLGSFVAFNNYSARFHGSLQNLTRLNANIQEALVSIKRVFDLIDSIETVEAAQDNLQTLPAFSGLVQLQNVKFGYSPDKVVIEDLSLEFTPYRWNALVGYSGIGKTTLFKLLLGFYTPNNGQILLDGISITKLEPYFIRRNIAYVSQEPFFFNASIKENLLYANPTASDAEIIEVCRKVKIHDYIDSLKDKYATSIAEMGSNFSSGQKQRLDIARALLKRPKVFLFDEPTSALDGETKQNILSLIRELTENHTVILISHDFDLVKNCDKIFLLDQGKISAQGKHELLLEKSELYQNLFAEFRKPA